MAAGYQFRDADVISPEVYGRISHPHEAFAWLRANDPLRFVEPEGYRPFWAVTKHADIIEIERQPELFASEPRPIVGPEITNPQVRADVIAQIFERLKDSPKLLQVLATSGQAGLIRSLVQMDAPDHPKYRELVQPWFKPANLKRLEDRLEVITRNILDEMMGDGSERTLDFVQDVAVFHPLKMIVELLGVPEEDEWRILKLTNELFAGDDPEMRRTGSDPLSLFETIKDLYEYFDRMTRRASRSTYRGPRFVYRERQNRRRIHAVQRTDLLLHHRRNGRPRNDAHRDVGRLAGTAAQPESVRTVTWQCQRPDEARGRRND